MDILPVLAIRARSERAAHNHDLLYFDLIQVTKASTQTARSACLCHFRSSVNAGSWSFTRGDLLPQALETVATSEFKT
jgi:hypothetical protein